MFPQQRRHNSSIRTKKTCHLQTSIDGTQLVPHVRTKTPPSFLRPKRFIGTTQTTISPFNTDNPKAGHFGRTRAAQDTARFRQRCGSGLLVWYSLKEKDALAITTRNKAVTPTPHSHKHSHDADRPVRCGAISPRELKRWRWRRRRHR